MLDTEMKTPIKSPMVREALGSHNDVCSRNLPFAELHKRYSAVNIDSFFLNIQIHIKYKISIEAFILPIF